MLKLTLLAWMHWLCGNLPALAPDCFPQPHPGVVASFKQLDAARTRKIPMRNFFAVAASISIM